MVRIPYPSPFCGQGQLRSRRHSLHYHEAGLTVPLDDCPLRVMLCVWTHTTSINRPREPLDQGHTLTLVVTTGWLCVIRVEKRSSYLEHPSSKLYETPKAQASLKFQQHIILRVALLSICHASLNIGHHIIFGIIVHSPVQLFFCPNIPETRRRNKFWEVQ